MTSRCCSCRSRRSANRTSICARPARSPTRLRPQFAPGPRSAKPCSRRPAQARSSSTRTAAMSTSSASWRATCASFADAGGHLPLGPLRTAEGSLHGPGSGRRHPCGRHGDLADAAFPPRPGAHGQGRQLRAVVGAHRERVQVFCGRPAYTPLPGSRRTCIRPARPATPRSRPPRRAKPRPNIGRPNSSSCCTM